LGESLIKEKDIKNKDSDDDILAYADSSGVNEIDILIREAEERQQRIEQELLDLAWD
jgi:hypothetical protein